MQPRALMRLSVGRLRARLLHTVIYLRRNIYLHPADRFSIKALAE